MERSVVGTKKGCCFDDDVLTGAGEEVNWKWVDKSRMTEARGTGKEKQAISSMYRSVLSKWLA